MTTYTLLGADGKPYASPVPGTLGGHRGMRIYGRLDCPSALRAIARGGYVGNRVFFADEPAAIAAGFRPCHSCLPEKYRAWKLGTTTGRFAVVVGAPHAGVRRHRAGGPYRGPGGDGRDARRG
jgi:hypothetical protein